MFWKCVKSYSFFRPCISYKIESVTHFPTFYMTNLYSSVFIQITVSHASQQLVAVPSLGSNVVSLACRRQLYVSQCTATAIIAGCLRNRCLLEGNLN